MSHAEILLGDQHSFPELAGQVAQMQLKVRWIKFRITRVINIKDDPKVPSRDAAEYLYIGRGSCWGSPYPIGEDGDDREDVIRKYKFDFDLGVFPTKKTAEVFKLKGKTLACHGDVLADYLNSYDDGR